MICSPQEASHEFNYLSESNAVNNCAHEFETWKQELREQLAVLEPHLSETSAEIKMARYAVDEFCQFDPPETADALTRLEQTRSVILLSLNSIWRSCFRRRLILH